MNCQFRIELKNKPALFQINVYLKFCLFKCPLRLVFCTFGTCELICESQIVMSINEKCPVTQHLNFHNITKQSKNICRGPGCRCGKYFYSREELQAHYYEKGCYKCSKCEDKFPSGWFQNYSFTLKSRCNR